jgi:hypothetical protein
MLNDPARVEQVARAHHEVVEAVARRIAAVPFRLATIYLGDERVRAFLAGERARLGALLRRVAGHAEWGVKAYVQPLDAPVAPAGPARGGKPGTAYLMRRREQLTRREAAWARAVARGDEVHRTLSGVAAEAVRHPVPAEDGPDEPGRLVLDAAYLIRSEASARFAGTVRELSVPGTRLHVTGPWAAYSFTALASTPPPAGAQPDTGAQLGSGVSPGPGDGAPHAGP